MQQYPSSFPRRRLCQALAAWPLSTAAQTPPRLSAAGASFPAKAYARWGAQYQAQRGVALDYRATGSGDGIQQAIARRVPLAGTDVPLAAAELRRQRLVQLPMLVGGIVPVLHLPGLEATPLRLSGPLLAEIFLGRVARWDDPRIAELNRGLALPARRIVRVVRADTSGSTEGFTRYLESVSPAFRQELGSSPRPAWPGEVEAGAGNDGVSARVRALPGSIGYVSHDRVEADQLSPVLLRNRDGQWVAAGEAGFRSAILHSGLHREGDDLAPLVERPGAGSWPITLTSFLLLDAEPPQAAAVEEAMRFLWWCFMSGDALTRGTGFAPLPTAVQARLVARLAAVAPRTGPRPAYQSL